MLPWCTGSMPSTLSGPVQHALLTLAPWWLNCVVEPPARCPEAWLWIWWVVFCWWAICARRDAEGLRLTIYQTNLRFMHELFIDNTMYKCHSNMHHWSWISLHTRHVPWLWNPATVIWRCWSAKAWASHRADRSLVPLSSCLVSSRLSSLSSSPRFPLPLTDASDLLSRFWHLQSDSFTPFLSPQGYVAPPQSSTDAPSSPQRITYTQHWISRQKKAELSEPLKPRWCNSSRWVTLLGLFFFSLPFMTENLTSLWQIWKYILKV